MPELPEVETIVRSLRSLEGKTFSDAQVLWARSLAEPGVDEFIHRISGQVIQTLSRRGKFIVMHLNRDTLLVHLRMSGDLRSEGMDNPVLPHDRVLFGFTDGARLAFNDARKFGRVWLVAETESVLGGLGLDPFDPSLTPGTFHHMLQEKSRQLKPLLLDQSFLAGLGNIYTDEALHLARLHPLQPSDRVTYEQADSLLASIRAVLEEGIRRNGASIDWVYRGGSFQNTFRVYQRTGEACLVCGTPVVRITVGQRGTHFCPTCQVVRE
jgi:formamidopyrimidine-DNA glycosylase